MDTLEARTGTGGAHVYFKAPSVALKNTAGTIRPGVDTRADGGFVVAPPSMHPNGQRYEWMRYTPPAELPAWLLALWPGRSGPPAASSTASGPVVPILDGARNATLTSLGGTMRRRGMTEAAIAAALLEENATRCHPPLSEAEVLGIAHSIGLYTPVGSGAPDGRAHFRGVRPAPMEERR